MRISPRLSGIFLVAVAIGSAADYFPPGALGKEGRFASEWYSKHLAALREPSLWDLSRQASPAEVYRFLWLRSFHHPISIRLTILNDGTGRLNSKEANGKGGYEPGKLIRDTTVTLSKERTEWFRERVDDTSLWKLPTKEPKKVNADGTVSVGLDGAQWIVEAVKGGRYHIVDRWSPPADDPVHGIGIILMIELAHFKLLYQDVY